MENTDPPHPTPARRLGDFEVYRELGRGGMGIVYEARQVSLNRKVALKVLAGFGLSPRAVVRFKREAEAAARLHHTNIVPIHATGEQEGTHYYAMELIEGPGLDQVIAAIRRESGSSHGQAAPGEQTETEHAWAVQTIGRGNGPEPSSDSAGTTLSSKSLGGGTEYFDTVARLMAEVADALDYAHAQGVIHRDIKPSNLLLSPVGRLSINDFGLARLLEQPGMTASGEFVGSPMYMSPEQIAVGRAPLDHRTDIYSLGATLYELLTLVPPFQGARREQVIAQIIHKEPRSPRSIDRKIPQDLETICLKMMEKDPDKRYQTAGAAAEDLRRYVHRFAIAARRAGPLGRMAKFLRRQWRGVAAAAAILVLAGVAAGLVIKYRAERTRRGIDAVRIENERWLRETAIPAIRQHMRAEDYVAAFLLTEEAESRVAGDPTLAELREQCSAVWSLRTEPSGAEVSVRTHRSATTAEWRPGRTPVQNVRLPRSLLRFSAVKAGHAPIEGIFFPWEEAPSWIMDMAGEIPDGMVRVPGNRFRPSLYYAVDELTGLNLPDFYIDRCEVTNRQYRRFMESGGYRRQEYWSEPILRDGVELPWAQAVKEFVDATGQPGPAVWRNGTYPPGEDEYPVRGISWHEAAAYAAFAGKRLPSVAHWLRASGVDYRSSIYQHSNVAGAGPVAVATMPGLGPFGTLDTAGNVKEWCWNGSGSRAGGRKYILGGSWSEPGYMFWIPDMRLPLDRSPANGLRCMALLGDDIPHQAFAELSLVQRGAVKSQPPSDEAFAAFKRMYDYDRLPLNARLVASEQTDSWVHETVEFDAAYSGERLTAHLYLPRNARPPYQTVVHFPGSGAFAESHFPGGEWQYSRIPELVKSGRAVAWPVVKGSYHRRTRPLEGWTNVREWVVQMVRDVERTVDYLESRGDIDKARLGYYGHSFGAMAGNHILALDARFKVGVFVAGGFPTHKEPLPELDAESFAPRVRVPVLMINGRNDGTFPYELCQRPNFEMLGSEPGQKQIKLFNAGHLVPGEDVAGEMMPWLDRYLGSAGAP